MKKAVDFCSNCELTDFIYKCVRCGEVFCGVCMVEHLVEEKILEIVDSGEIISLPNGKKKKIILICDFCDGDIEDGNSGYSCLNCGKIACDDCASDNLFIEHVFSEIKNKI